MGELSTIERAARGDVEAQREMIDVALSLDTPETHREAVTWAEFWARVAIAHGQLADKRRLAALLGLRINEAFERGDVMACHAFYSEAIALLTILADAGDEEAATVLGQMVDDSDPDHVAMAKEFLKMWGVE